METTNTKKAAISATITGETLTLDFANGQRLVLETQMLAEDVLTQALMHGLKQKLVDAAAISRNPDTGRSATIEDKYQSVREVYDRLLSGQWNKGREGGGGAGGLLFRALVALYPKKTAQDIREWLDGMNEKQQAAVRRVPEVAAKIEEFRAAQAKSAGIDGNELLAGLED